MATKKTSSHVQQLYISKIAEKSPQQQFEGDRTISAVITLWESFTKSPSSQIAVTSCHDYPLTSFLPMVGIDKHTITHPKSGQTITQTSSSWISLQFQKQWEDSIMMLGSTQQTYLIKKSTVSSFKLQQACETRLQFHYCFSLKNSI
jgi:hypothetical protein